MKYTENRGINIKSKITVTKILFSIDERLAYTSFDITLASSVSILLLASLYFEDNIILITTIVYIAKGVSKQY